MKQLLLRLALLNFIFTFSVMAEQQPQPSPCEDVLSKGVRMIPSGMEGKHFTDMYAFAEEMFREGGLYQRLNISRPYQVIQFMGGGDLNSLGSINAMPVAHWIDGAKISKTSRRGLLYEIVIGGKDEQYSFYRDDNHLEEQINIFEHATAGHNHFTVNTRFRHFRSANRIPEAYALSEYMDQLRTRMPATEVSRWYQYLASLDYSQDMINARYETPEDLAQRPPAMNLTDQTAKRFAPTANILQTFVANLPADMPEWKKEMARRYERLQRYIPGAVRTKIMNEGWSTLMQLVLPKHTKYNTAEDAIKYCCFLSGIVHPSITNPYWLGLEAWKNIYEKFLKRPEIQKLADWEAKDAAFILFATKEIIAVMDDEMFLRYALDPAWVAKQNLALTRAYKDNEYNGDPPAPDPYDQKRNWPYSIITRDADKVIEALVAQVKGFQYQFPNVILESLNDQGSGQVGMNLSDTVGRSIALDRTSMVETLLVMAQIQERPIALESTFDFPREIPPPDDIFGPWRRPRFWPPPVIVYEKTRVKVVVTPMGEVKAYIVKRNGSADPSTLPQADIFRKENAPQTEYVEDVALSKELKEYADAYIDNLTMEEKVDEETFKSTSILMGIERVVEEIVGGVSTSLHLSIPTVPRAVTEYEGYVGRRISAALKAAIHGRGRIIRGSTGVSVAALPRIPHFQFDSKSLQREFAKAKAPALPRQSLVRHMNSFTATEVFRPTDLVDVRPIPGQDGDVFWGPRPKPGEGEGEGEGDPNLDASDDGGDIIFEHVNLDVYADALNEEIQLPHLRPKQGIDIKTEDEMFGHKQQVSGIPHRPGILRKAYKRGLAASKTEEGDEASGPQGPQVIRRGLAQIRRETDWVVKDFQPRPNPEINAVVVFKMDMSGSMEYVKETAKQIIYDLRAILQKKYKKVKFVYMSFNSQATVFEDADEFFKVQPDGGTVYSRAYEKTVEEVYPQYPLAQWDRYSVTVGDLYEAFTEKERSTFEALKEASQFTTTFWATEYPDFVSDLAKYLESMADQDEYVGFARVIPASSYRPGILKEAFKNKKE